MAYSTIAQLRANLKIMTVAIMGDAFVTDRIAQADDEIETDLAGVIDFTLVTASDPVFINKLSQWKTNELCLVYSYSAKRETTQVDDISYWRDKYDKLIQMIRDGLIPLVLADGTSIAGSLGGTQTYTDPKSGIHPAMGMGDYGTFQDNDDKLNDEDRG